MSKSVSKTAVHCCVATTLLLAGCGGSDGGATPPTADQLYSVAGIAGPLSSRLALQPVGIRSLGLNLRFPPKRAKRETFYLSKFEGELYDGFKLPKTKPFCATDLVKDTLVNSIAATSDKAVWLPVEGPPTGIFAFAPGCGAQIASLSVPKHAGPVGVVFDANETAYGLMSYATDLTGSVEVYPKGSTKPQAEYTDPRLRGTDYHTIDAIGIDAKKRVYVSCCYQNPFVIVFSGSGSQTHGKKIQLEGVSYAGGSISFDKAGNMVIPSWRASTLYIIAPPYKGKATMYQLQGRSWQCSLNPKETELACGNAEADTADIYSYPSITYEYSVASTGYGSIPAAGAAFVPSH